MRIVPIVVGLIVGIVGLFMSVCGGGFLITLGFDALRNAFGVHGNPGGIFGLLVLLIPAGSLALGIVVSRLGYRILREHLKDK